MAYAYPLKQFVCAPCVNMANVSRCENKTCANHKMSKAHILIWHIVIQ
jgi:hypothetical protein